MNEDIQLIPDSREVKVNGNTVRLTHNQFRLFALLVQLRGQVVKKSVIDQMLWPETGDRSNSIEVIIYNIRYKLRKAGWAGIENIQLVGYRIK